MKVTLAKPKYRANKLPIHSCRINLSFNLKFYSILLIVVYSNNRLLGLRSCFSAAFSGQVVFLDFRWLIALVKRTNPVFIRFELGVGLFLIAKLKDKVICKSDFISTVKQTD